MLISVITTTFNSQSTIIDSLNSVLSQSYKDIEHIIIDGNSYDYTRSILEDYKKKNKNSIIKFINDKGLFDAMNYGINIAKGDYITFLNSDDIFHNNSTIENVAKKIRKYKDHKVFYGDVNYFSKNHKNIVRNYSGGQFKIDDFRFGLMPPHPGSFVETQLHKNFRFNTKYKIASDFDLLLRLFLKKKIKTKYLNMSLVRMKVGGNSGKNIITYLKSTIELYKICRRNKIKTNYIKILSRIPKKIGQFFLFKKKDLNKNFQLPRKIIDKKPYHIVKISKKFNTKVYKKNFVYSAMNLAFIGNYFNGKLCLYEELIHWPDGIFSKLLNKNLKKNPGREFLKDIKMPINFKSINIIGNANNKDINFLKKKFTDKKIFHSKLPYSNTKGLTKHIPILHRNSVTFVTLPTPKQEQIAYLLSKQNKYFHIFCIGAALGINSGNEKPVPNFLYKLNLEFLWRLRKETLRRINRLVTSSYFYFLGKLKKMDKDIKVKVV